MVPTLAHVVSILMLLTGAGCALWLVSQVVHAPQQMRVMNVVWPVSGLYAGPLAVWAYRRWGRTATRPASEAARTRGEDPPARRKTPFAAMVLKGAGHCGSGCTLGDIAAEWLAFAWPAVLLATGWHGFFEKRLYAVWVLDFALAFAIGIVFQYFAIVPMRGLGVADGLRAALKADALSLTAWQLGMYGFMAFAHFVVFARWWQVRLDVTAPEFWAAMQIAMLCGLVTSYPVNWWLLRIGWKERM